MARMTREEKAEQFNAKQRTKKVAEFKQRIAKARSLTVYNERLVFDSVDKRASVLFDMVRQFTQSGADLHRKTQRLIEEMQNALVKIDANEQDVFSYSNPLATPGSDIEALHTKRKVLVDAIQSIAYALDYYVPQVQNKRALEQRRRLVNVDVLQSTDGREMWRIEIEGTPLTGVDMRLQKVDAANPLVSEYNSEESAWLAAAEYVGDRY